MLKCLSNPTPYNSLFHYSRYLEANTLAGCPGGTRRRQLISDVVICMRGAVIAWRACTDEGRPLAGAIPHPRQPSWTV